MLEVNNDWLTFTAAQAANKLKRRQTRPARLFTAAQAANKSGLGRPMVLCLFTAAQAANKTPTQ